MVMGGDSCCKGHGFEFPHCILDGHFFTYICCKNCNICLKRRKYMKRGLGMANLKKIDHTLSGTVVYCGRKLQL